MQELSTWRQLEHRHDKGISRVHLSKVYNLSTKGSLSIRQVNSGNPNQWELRNCGPVAVEQWQSYI